MEKNTFTGSTNKQGKLVKSARKKIYVGGASKEWEKRGGEIWIFILKNCLSLEAKQGKVSLQNIFKNKHIFEKPVI